MDQNEGKMDQNKGKMEQNEGKMDQNESLSFKHVFRKNGILGHII